MDTLIGLGQAGCNIVKEFSKYPQYECYYIDSDIRQEACFYKVEKQDNCEEYENNAPSFDGFFDNVTDNILFVSGKSAKVFIMGSM